MIHVRKSRLSRVEYLFEQSARGNHVLFDSDRLRQVWDSPWPFSEEEAYSVEHHLERLIEEPSLAAQRAYVESLDSDTFRKLVQTYFAIVESSLFENLEVRH